MASLGRVGGPAVAAVNVGTGRHGSGTQVRQYCHRRCRGWAAAAVGGGGSGGGGRNPLAALHGSLRLVLHRCRAPQVL